MIKVETDAKAEWTKPVIVDLDAGMEGVENFFAPGADGAGGYSSSTS